LTEDVRETYTEDLFHVVFQESLKLEVEFLSSKGSSTLTPYGRCRRSWSAICTVIINSTASHESQFDVTVGGAKSGGEVVRKVFLRVEVHPVGF
jgi:hypothetical protein